ncbi:sigma-70 family RNA polymerase sigma factor [Acidothermaceae bacterium B102]|nr:sigma-70 family RNA polymerase sigma factor [Acidothermaceae bacterium B102]
MAYAAAALPLGRLNSGLARRLDALICALLQVQLAESAGPRLPRPARRALLPTARTPLGALSADAEPYPVELRVIQPSMSATARSVPTQPATSPQGPNPDEPQIVDTADNTRDLVLRAQQGDPDAFGALYDRYVDLVHRYVYYRVGSQQLAEDLTSETFLRALRRISSYTWQGVDIGAWFVTIARNLVADHYKSGRYRLEVQVHEVGDDRTLDGPENEVLDALDHRVLLEAVTRLGAEQQECIVLRFLQGLSVSETALVMGKNDGAVKALQYRAVRSLSRLLPAGFVR